MFQDPIDLIEVYRKLQAFPSSLHIINDSDYSSYMVSVYMVSVYSRLSFGYFWETFTTLELFTYPTTPVGFLMYSSL